LIERVARVFLTSFRRLAKTGSEPWVVLVPALVVQWLAVLVMAVTVRHNGWLYYQGGDQTFYWTTSWLLSDLQLPITSVGYAWSFLLTPISLFAGPNVLSGLPAVILFQTIVLLPIALLCVYGIAARIGGRVIGYTAVGLWVVLPYAAIPLFVDRYHEKWNEQTLPQTFGFSGLADFPSMVALLIGTFFLFRVMDRRDWYDAAFAGLAIGFALGLKPANALFVPAAALGLALARAWRELFVAAAAAAPAVLTLAVWKQRGLGRNPLFQSAQPSGGGDLAASALPIPPTASISDWINEHLKLDWGVLHDNLDQLREFFWAVRPLEWIPLAGLLAIGRRSWSKAVFVFGWFACFFVFKGTDPHVRVEDASFWRLMMPSYPAYLFLFAAVPLLVPQLGGRLAMHWPHANRALLGGRRRMHVLGAAAAIFALAPLVFIAAVPVQSGPKAVQDLENALFLPISGGFAPEAQRTAGGFRVSWRRPYDGPVAAWYVVYRQRPTAADPYDPLFATRGISCRTKEMSPGAADCKLVMDKIAVVRATSFLDDPGQGRWVYRVGLLANWHDDPELGDVLLLSEPVVVG
jgi:hypothetical protein